MLIGRLVKSAFLQFLKKTFGKNRKTTLKVMSMFKTECPKLYILFILNQENSIGVHDLANGDLFILLFTNALTFFIQCKVYDFGSGDMTMDYEVT